MSHDILVGDAMVGGSVCWHLIKELIFLAVLLLFSVNLKGSELFHVFVFIIRFSKTNNSSFSSFSVSIFSQFSNFFFQIFNIPDRQYFFPQYFFYVKRGHKVPEKKNYNSDFYTPYISSPFIHYSSFFNFNHLFNTTASNLLKYREIHTGSTSKKNG